MKRKKTFDFYKINFLKFKKGIRKKDKYKKGGLKKSKERKCPDTSKISKVFNLEIRLKI